MPAGKDSVAEEGARCVGSIADGGGGDSPRAGNALSKRKGPSSAGKNRVDSSTHGYGKISRRRVGCAISHWHNCLRSRERLRAFRELAAWSALNHLAALAVVTAIGAISRKEEARGKGRADS